MLVVLNVYLCMFVWLPAIVPMIFCRFWEPHRAGEVLPIFFGNDSIFLFCREERIRSSPAPCRSACTASPHHSTTTLGITPVPVPWS